MEINIPFADAITQMPNYAKFLKDILSKKKRIADERVVSLTTTCSAVIQKSLPTKMKDPNNFTISCIIGKYEFKKDLCISGANINLMPLSVVHRLCNTPKYTLAVFDLFRVFCKHNLTVS